MMKISIIIPSLNRKQDLSLCLESILSQSQLPDEILIIGSKNDFQTQTLIENLKQFNNIRMIFSEGGTCKSRNIGVDNSIGDIIIFLDDDVIIEKNYIYYTYNNFLRSVNSVITGYTFDLVNLTTPSIRNKNDVSYIQNSENEFFHNIVKIINDKKLELNYSITGYFIKNFKRFFKILFLLDGIKKGQIMKSGYRSDMPDYLPGKQYFVQWIYGNNFSCKREIIVSNKFDESLEQIMPYALNEDLELSSRIGLTNKIILDNNLLVFHTRSSIGYRGDIKKRIISFKKSTLIIAERRGNIIAHMWAMIGVWLDSTIIALTNSDIEIKWFFSISNFISFILNDG